MDYQKIMRSRTNWTIFGMFLVGGLASIQEFIPMEFEALVMGVLGIAAIYFKMNPSQKYGKTT